MGKRVVVDGTIRRQVIVDKVNPHTRTFNRYQHSVAVLFPNQIVSVE